MSNVQHEHEWVENLNEPVQDVFEGRSTWVCKICGETKLGVIRTFVRLPPDVRMERFPNEDDVETR